MLQLFRTNSPYAAIMLFIFALLVHMQGLMHPVFPIATEAQFLYAWLLNILLTSIGHSAFAASLLAVVLLYVQAIFLNAIAMQHRLFPLNSYLPAFTFIALSALHPNFGILSPQLVLNFLVLFVLNEFLKLKQVQQANKHLFNIGFAMMLAAQLQFAAIFLALFVFFALMILRPFSLREWMIMLIGLITPLYITAVLLFCTDHLHLLVKWPDLGISLPRELKPAYYYLLLFLGLVLWLLRGVYNLQTQLSKATIYIRRCWMSVSFLLFFSIIAALLSNSHIDGVWLICLPVLSLLMANAFINERSKKMNIISFYFAVILVLFCQIFLPS